MQPGVDERLRYADLARRAAAFRGRYDATLLTRFRGLCTPLEPVDVHLTFEAAPAGEARVRGHVATRVAVECHRCAEPVECRLDSAFEVRIAADDAEATRLGTDHDVVVADSGSITVAALVEDELILALPERPCTVPDCERRPGYRYPPRAAAEVDEDRTHPFKDLADRMRDN
jgi:uncharacterized protein